MSIASPDKETFFIRVLMIGNSGSQKESLHSILSKKLSQVPQIPTIGIDFTTISIKIENITIRIQLWDTAGQERFRSFTNTYFKGAHGILAVFSTSNLNSFDFIEEVVDLIKKKRIIANQAILIVGINDENQREVSLDEGMEKAIKLGVNYIEVSLNKPIQLEEMLRILGNQIISSYMRVL